MTNVRKIQFKSMVKLRMDQLDCYKHGQRELAIGAAIDFFNAHI